MIGLSRLSATKAAAITALPPLHQLTQLTLSRFYSGAASTAQPQLDYSSSDYYYYDYNNHKSRRDRLARAPKPDSENSGPIRPVQWVFLGSPSAKKHVFAERLSKLLEVPHISIAILVRQDLSPRSSLYKQIANAVNCGELVPEDIIFGLLSKRLEDGYYQGENGFILDGIPRSPIQAEILDQLAEIDLVVNFKCSEDGLLKHREEANWKEKIQLYAEQSKVLEDYYKKQKKLLEFQVGNAPGETWQGLLAALHLQHIVAAHSSRKLTTGIDQL